MEQRWEICCSNPSTAYRNVGTGYEVWRFDGKWAAGKRTKKGMLDYLRNRFGNVRRFKSAAAARAAADRWAKSGPIDQKPLPEPLS